MSGLNKKLFVFDLDGTLTSSKTVIDPEMAELLVNMLKKFKVAVISGGGFPQFQTQFLSGLPGTTDCYSNLYLLPTSGTKLYIWKGSWTQEYSENLTPEEKARILSAINSALISAKYDKPAKIYGQLIEDRASQITFSALGQAAPSNEKDAWDPTREKRTQIAELISQKIPEFDVRIGGSTSIDVTRKGINKAYGIRKLEQYLKISLDDMIFVGDALFCGGNDFPVKAIGVDCLSVKGPSETKEIIRKWL